jgi:hypothetical protein
MAHAFRNEKGEANYALPSVTISEKSAIVENSFANL